VAAHLARGVPISDFGSPLPDCVRLSWPAVERAGELIVGEVVYIDHFGNLFTNVRERDLTGIAKDKIRVHLNEIEIRGLSQNYVAAGKSRYIALFNSWGLLEVASCNGSAASRSAAKIGDKMRVELIAV